MPLYTCVVVHKGRSYIAQSRVSNPRAATKDWTTDLPLTAFPGFTDALRAKLQQAASRAPFEDVPNRCHVWRRTVAFDGLGFEIHVIQTEA